MTWTDEQFGVALFLLQEKYPTAEVAKRVGVSKNALIGKVHREGMDINTLRGVQPIQRPHVTRREKHALEAIMPAFTPDPCTIGYLTDARCHWPMWDDRTPTTDRFYCGAPVSGKVYCLEHWRRATNNYPRSSRDPAASLTTVNRSTKLPKSMVL